MSAAKKIERDAIRFIMHIQIHDPSYAIRILLNIFVFPLLLPSTPQGLVELHERQSLVELGLHQIYFR
jgi:hypothetical protein